ncbi:uncharacterized protein VK521_003580 isoform 1-T1 [Ammospiza maritima maritima]
MTINAQSSTEKKAAVARPAGPHAVNKVSKCLTTREELKSWQSDQKCDIQERKRYFRTLSQHLRNHIPAVLRLSHFWKPAPPSAPTTNVHTIEIQSFSQRMTIIHLKRKYFINWQGHLNERELEISPV